MDDQNLQVNSENLGVAPEMPAQQVGNVGVGSLGQSVPAPSNLDQVVPAPSNSEQVVQTQPSPLNNPLSSSQGVAPSVSQDFSQNNQGMVAPVNGVENGTLAQNPINSSQEGTLTDSSSLASLNTGMGNAVPTQAASVESVSATPTQIPVSMMAERENSATPVPENLSNTNEAPGQIPPLDNLSAEDATKNKKKYLLIGGLSFLGVALLAGILYMVFSGGDESLVPTNKLGAPENSPPSVVSPFEEEALVEVNDATQEIRDTLTEDTEEATDLEEVVNELSESAPPALNLIDQIEQENESDVENTEETTPVKRVTR